MATVRPYGPTMSGVPNDGSLVGLVRGWANRDERALPDEIIMDAIRYAVDKAYRMLRIPPLEHTVRYTQADLEAASIGQGNVYQSVTALAVPSDLIEFIQIRGTDDSGLTTRVFNEKSDIRSYWDRFNTHYDQGAFWSRQGDQILITPSVGQVASGYYGGFTSPETCVELYYYRRLPALSATFSRTANNWSRGLGELRNPTGGIITYDAVNAQTELDAMMEDPDNPGQMIPTNTWTGNSVPNWFKDENERIALYGALAECFAYLQEDDQAGKYTQLMMKEIEELNEEDRARDASGGNVQVQYNARGLI